MNSKNLLLPLLVLLTFSVSAKEKEVVIDSLHVKGGIYMLKGQGGNIGLFTDKDGLFMIDGQYAPLTEKIKAAIKAISASPIKFLINTHWHGDHVGGNQNFAHTGAIIIAHKNVRKRMSSEQRIKLSSKKSHLLRTKMSSRRRACPCHQK